jgi:UDP-N-acetylmuramoyl-tripeptide--D-alanyl-D-alanine ligase
MRFWAPDNLRLITAGRWLKRTDELEMFEPTGVSTDTRTLQRGQMFIALRGERFDGHDFLEAAAQAGASVLVVDREASGGMVTAKGVAVLLVENTYTALARLAGAYRRTLSGTIIAITGSVGKTTTKQMIHAVLATAYKGTASPKSFNNHIGVPLTLLNAATTDRYVVVEVGTNAPGEIAGLAKIVEPNVAIITYIGSAHLERLGSKQAIADEKASLLRFIRDDGLAIVNGDMPELAEHLKAVSRLVRFGSGDANDLRLTRCQRTAGGIDLTINDRSSFHVPMLGRHNAINAMAAVAVGRHMNLSDEQIAEGLLSAEPARMRLNLTELGEGEEVVTVINDAYNANPDSMAAAVDVLANLPVKGRRVAVLGDMAELGEHAAALHRDLGVTLANAPIDLAVLIGPMMMFTAETLSKHWPAERIHAMSSWAEGVADEAAALLQPGDTVLIKASRSAGLERLLPAITRRFNATDALPTD